MIKGAACPDPFPLAGASMIPLHGCSALLVMTWYKAIFYLHSLKYHVSYWNLDETLVCNIYTLTQENKSDKTTYSCYCAISNNLMQKYV